MSAPVDEVAGWYERNPLRRAPEVDFGSTWTSLSAPHAPWRVSWNSGSHELFAARLDGREVQVLAVYDSAAEADAALAGWGQLALRPGGLDWMREQTRDFGIAVGGGRDELADALQYRMEHFDELEMSGRINLLDAYIEGLESSLDPTARHVDPAGGPAAVMPASEREWLREQLAVQRPTSVLGLGLEL